MKNKLCKLSTGAQADFIYLNDQILKERKAVMLVKKALRHKSKMISLTPIQNIITLVASAPIRLAADMSFFTSAIDTLKTIVIALGGGLSVWGGINLLEGYGGDNPSAKSQGMKQLIAGCGIAIIGIVVVPLLKGLITT